MTLLKSTLISCFFNAVVSYPTYWGTRQPDRVEHACATQPFRMYGAHGGTSFDFYSSLDTFYNGEQTNLCYYPGQEMQLKAKFMESRAGYIACDHGEMLGESHADEPEGLCGNTRRYFGYNEDGQIEKVEEHSQLWKAPTDGYVLCMVSSASSYSTKIMNIQIEVPPCFDPAPTTQSGNIAPDAVAPDAVAPDAVAPDAVAPDAVSPSLSTPTQSD